MSHRSTTVADLLSLEEVARLTQLSQRTISAYIAFSRIPSLKIGHARLFDRRAIEGWIAERVQRRRQIEDARALASIS